MSSRWVEEVRWSFVSCKDVVVPESIGVTYVAQLLPVKCTVF